MVRYTRPPSPTWQVTTRSAPTKHLSDQHRKMAVIKSQDNENKGIIWIVKAVFAVTDEGGEGGVPLIDMTKVTSSTPAGKPLPHRGADLPTTAVTGSKAVLAGLERAVRQLKCLILLFERY